MEHDIEKVFDYLKHAMKATHNLTVENVTPYIGNNVMMYDTTRHSGGNIGFYGDITVNYREIAVNGAPFNGLYTAFRGRRMNELATKGASYAYSHVTRTNLIFDWVGQGNPGLGDTAPLDDIGDPVFGATYLFPLFTFTGYMFNIKG